MSAADVLTFAGAWLLGGLSTVWALGAVELLRLRATRHHGGDER